MTSTRAELGDLDALATEEPFVRALARSLLFDDHQVDDVVQQTWLEALRRGLPTGDARRGWLARVVRSRASNARRGAARRTGHERAAARPEAIGSPEELLARTEQRRLVVGAVAALSEPYRTAVMLRYFEGLTPQSIARQLALPLDTVNTRLKRARNILRDRLDAEYGGDRRRWMSMLVPLAATRAGAGSAVMANVLGLFAWIAAMKPILIVVSGVLLSWLLVQSIGAGDPDAAVSPQIADGGIPADLRRDSRVANDRVPPLDAPTRTLVAEAGPRASGPAPLDRRQLAALVGRLVETDGQPAAHRRIRLLSVDPVRCHPGGFEPLTIADGAAFRGQEVETDDVGAFAFETIPAGDAHALWFGVGGPNATLRPLGFELPAGRRTDLGVIALEPHGAFVGRVVDANGEPVAGARVRAMDLPGALFGLAPVDRLTVGGALLCALPDASGIADRVDGARAFAEAVREFMSANVPQAEAGAEFAVLEFPAWMDGALSSLPVPEAVTDGDGRFRVDGVVAGDHALIVEAAGFAKLSRPRIPLRDVEVRDLGALRLGAGETLACRVIDANGRPAVGVQLRIALRPRAGLTGVLFADPARETGADGTCEFDCLPRGEFVVVCRRDARSPWQNAGLFDSDEDVEITLPPERSLRIRVHDAEDRPILAARFRLWQGPMFGEVSAAGLHAPLPVEFEADANTPGGFVADGLVAGIYTLGTIAPGQVFDQRLVTVRASEDAPTVDVGLLPGVDCEITVVDSTGDAVRAAEVYVLADGDAHAPFGQSILFRSGDFPAWDRLTRGGLRTDVDGRLRIDGLPRGGAYVIARHRSLGRVSARIATLTEAVRVAFAAPGSIEGRVLDRGTLPQTGQVDVRLRPADDDGGFGLPDVPRLARVDADGAFHFDAISPGTWTVTAERRSDAAVRSLGDLVQAAAPSGFDSFGPDGDRHAIAVVSPGAVTQVVLDLDPLAAGPGAGGATVRGSVALDGAPLANIALLAKDADRSAYRSPVAFAATDTNGQFERLNVDARDFSLIAEVCESPLLRWQQSVIAPDRGDQRIDFVSPTAWLEVAVRTQDGRPAADHRVIANGSPHVGGSATGSANTDADGIARLRLPLGVYDVYVEGDGGSIARDGVLVDAAGSLALSLSPDEMLRVTVALAGDQEVETLILTDDANRTMWFMPVPEPERVVRFHGLRPGSYALMLDTPNGRCDTDPPTIEVHGHGATDATVRIGEPRR